MNTMICSGSALDVFGRNPQWPICQIPGSPRCRPWGSFFQEVWRVPYFRAYPVLRYWAWPCCCFRIALQPSGLKTCYGCWPCWFRLPASTCCRGRIVTVKTAKTQNLCPISFSRHMHVLKAFFKVQFSRAIVYRFGFWTAFFGDLILFPVQQAVFGTIAKNGTIGGWTTDHLTVFTGTFIALDGLYMPTCFFGIISLRTKYAPEHWTCCLGSAPPAYFWHCRSCCGTRG